MADAPSNAANPAAGSPAAKAAELLPAVYDELRALAAAKLAREAPGHTLQPTALVHEVFLKLADQSRAVYRDRMHFMAVAAEAIRRILVDHARRRGAAKRAAPGQRVTITADLDGALGNGVGGAALISPGGATGRELDVVELDEAMTRLAAISPRQARVVELRFFGGLELTEVATLLGVSEGTVKGDWRIARAWLQQQLSPGPQP